MEIEEIDDEIKKLEQKKEEIIQVKLEKMVGEGKAFKCSRCKKIIICETASPAEKSSGYCWNCKRILDKREREKEIYNKLRAGTVVDIDMKAHGYTAIKALHVYKDFRVYEIKANSEDGELYIADEWRDEIDLPLEKRKPWKKERKEKKLIGDESDKCKF